MIDQSSLHTLLSTVNHYQVVYKFVSVIGIVVQSHLSCQLYKIVGEPFVHGVFRELERIDCHSVTYENKIT